MGKLVVATSEAQRADLTRIKALAERNGVDDLRLLVSVLKPRPARAVAEAEPEAAEPAAAAAAAPAAAE